MRLAVARLSRSRNAWVRICWAMAMARFLFGSSWWTTKYSRPTGFCCVEFAPARNACSGLNTSMPTAWRMISLSCTASWTASGLSGVAYMSALASWVPSASAVARL